MSLSKPRSQGRRLARRSMMQSGSSAMEFVLILPAMLFLVFGVIILGLTAFSSLFAAASVPLDARDWAVTGELGTRTQDFLGVSPSVTIDPDCDRAAHVRLSSSTSTVWGAFLGVWTASLQSGTTAYRMVFNSDEPTQRCQ